MSLESPDNNPTKTRDLEELLSVITDVMIQDVAKAMAKLGDEFEHLIERLMLAKKCSEDLSPELQQLLSDSSSNVMNCIVAMQFHDRLDQRLVLLRDLISWVSDPEALDEWDRRLAQVESLYTIYEGSELHRVTSRLSKDRGTTVQENAVQENSVGGDGSLDFELF